MTNYQENSFAAALSILVIIFMHSDSCVLKYFQLQTAIPVVLLF